MRAGIAATWLAASAVLVRFHPNLAAQEIPTADLRIAAPLEGAVFPRDFAAPTVRWSDIPAASRWRVEVFTGKENSVQRTRWEGGQTAWRLSEVEWNRIKRETVNQPGRIVVSRLDTQGDIGASAANTFWTSPDPVGASVFFREVPLPVSVAMDNKKLISWKVGDVSSGRIRTLLTGMKTCANCHSFSRDAKTLAMDVDFGSDKSTYAIATVGTEVRIDRPDLIAWNDYRREDGEPTLGFLSTISPDGRYVLSTVKETIILDFPPDPFCSQIFFPVRGILALYDRRTRTFRGLPGGDDPAFVQTSATFSPDGRNVVFARAKNPEIPRLGIGVDPDVMPRVAADFTSGARKIQYELHRVPFNGGAGGTPVPIPGASANGVSNFFPRYSPDGKWIVFCQASSMMLNRPDSALHIMPAAGGTPRRLRCNAPGRMNSWHSFSPNGRWLVFASKATGPMTQMWLTHIDENGEDSVPVMLDGWVAPDRAANLPEFVKLAPGQLQAIIVSEEIRASVAPPPTAGR